VASGEEGIPDFEYNIPYDELVIENEIGHGGFGVVYHASYFGTSVAVKQIPTPTSPEEKLFLKREVAILKGVRHPNCVQFIGLTNDQRGNTNIVTEYVSGGNLRSALKDKARILPWYYRISVCNDIASAMAYLHSKNILFRDLKSKNILLEESGKAKICDFGLARSGLGMAARPMTICGTDDWMAPEVILGMDYNTQADVFSYGIVLLEVVTRAKVSLELQRSPMDAFGLNEEQAKRLIPEDCPKDFALLAFTSSAYEPEQRPPFKQIVQIFAKLLKELPKEMPGQSAPAPAPKAAAAPAPKAAAAPAPKAAAAPSPKSAAPTPAPAPKASLAPKPSTPAPKPSSGNSGNFTPAPSGAPKAGGKRVGGISWPPK